MPTPCLDKIPDRTSLGRGGAYLDWQFEVLFPVAEKLGQQSLKQLATSCSQYGRGEKWSVHSTNFLLCMQPRE